MPDERLPPFPDALLDAAKKDAAIAFLRGLRLPARIASTHLGRWAAYVGVTLDRGDYFRVRGDVSHPSVR